MDNHNVGTGNRGIFALLGFGLQVIGAVFVGCAIVVAIGFVADCAVFQMMQFHSAMWGGAFVPAR